ncbi:hypothetical protein FQN49_006908 [Arthroderma sp. PD_2]|nr:hypothetical protein FQN49_006908 [Arthroderma sp. PD_2]
MVKFTFFLSALALLDLAAAATRRGGSGSHGNGDPSSMMPTPQPNATTMSETPASPTISLFAPGATDLGIGSGFDEHLNVSLVGINQPLTTIALCLTPLVEPQATCDDLAYQTYTVDASNTFRFSTELRTLGGTAYRSDACTIMPSKATCTLSISVTAYGASTRTQATATFTGDEVTFIPATITAGAEKLTQATATPTGSGPPEGAGSRAADIPKIALVGVAALMGAAFAL